MIKGFHDFAADDPRARLTWDGATYRATAIYRESDGELSVGLIRQTKRGRDYRPGHPRGGMWLTLRYSLDRFGDESAKALAAYVREIAAAAEAAPEAPADYYAHEPYGVHVGDVVRWNAGSYYGPAVERRGVARSVERDVVQIEPEDGGDVVLMAPHSLIVVSRPERQAATDDNAREIGPGPCHYRQDNGSMWRTRVCTHAAEAVAPSPEPRVNAWLAVDYPSRLRTVARGFRSRGHAVSYARNRAGWHPYVPAAWRVGG